MGRDDKRRDDFSGGVADVRKKRREQNRRLEVETVIAKSVTIHGEVKTSGSLRVDGVIDGVVEAEGDVVIGEGGAVKSRIAAENVVLAGRMDGDVEAKGRLHILAGGQLIGNATVGVLLVEEGAVFKGECVMPVRRGNDEAATVARKVLGGGSKQKEADAVG